jgi:hypothetical protein
MNTTNVTVRAGRDHGLAAHIAAVVASITAVLTAFAGRLDEQDQELAALKIRVEQMVADERMAPYRPPAIVETMTAGSPHPVADYSPPLYR